MEKIDLGAELAAGAVVTTLLIGFATLAVLTVFGVCAGHTSLQGNHNRSLRPLLFGEGKHGVALGAAMARTRMLPQEEYQKDEYQT